MKNFSWKISSFLLFLTLFTSQTHAANGDQAIGTGINSIRNWITSVPFVDLFKSASAFPATTGVTYDEQGWPEGLPTGTSVASTVITSNLTTALPAGNYVITYQGDGQVSYVSSGSVVESTPGRDVLYLDPQARRTYLQLRIDTSNPLDPVRDIHVTLPGGICAAEPTIRVGADVDCINGDFLSFEDNHSSIIFNPAFLNFTKDFRVLRYMDFMETNGSTVETWEDRTRLDDAVWSGEAGAPVEIMVALANASQADAWINIPHLADDTYVQEFARYVRDNLDDGLKAHVEYTNEAWANNVQGVAIKNLGQSLGLDPNWSAAGGKYYARRSVEIFKIWETELGGLDRMVRVLSGQLVNTWITGIILSFENAYESADVFGVNAYVSGDATYFREEATTVEDIFTEMRNPDTLRLSLPKQIEKIQAQAELANQYGLELVAFEGGQGLVDFTTTTDDQHPNPLFYAANRDAEMAVMYNELLNAWKDAGGTLFVHFSAPGSYTKNGSWGVTEYIGQPRSEAPKLDALLNFMDTTSCWWEGCDGGNNNGGGTSTIDFESVTAGNFNPLSIDGFEFTPESFPNLEVYNDGSNQSVSPYWGGTMRMVRSDAASFNLQSFNARGRWNGISSSIEIVGTQSDGTQLNDSVSYDSLSWVTKSLNWTDLINVDFYTPDGRALFDEMVVSAESDIAEWQTVATYQDNYQPITPAEGWTFYWNETAPFGTASGYSPLVWNGEKYNSNGLLTRPSPDELRYGQLTAVGGHPGLGLLQGAIADRYVIAGYEVSTAGEFRISNSQIQQAGCQWTNGLDLQVYVNDSPLLQLNVPADGSATGFDGLLGTLTQGDTIYVGVGPDGSDGCDGFLWNYSIDRF